MEWFYGLLILAVGIASGLALARLLRARRERLAMNSVVHSTVDQQAQALIRLLRSGAVVVGAHDEVVDSNAVARTMFLVRGTRISQPQILESVREARRRQRTVTAEVEVPRGMGASKLHLNIRVAPLDQSMVVVLAEDRTPLLRLDETRRDFVANVSHELKTPIGAVSLLAEAIREARDDPDAVDHFAARLEHESGRLTELVTQIIELSRLQSGDPMLTRESVPIVELVDAAHNRVREMAKRRNISIVTTGDDQLEVNGDRALLADAIANLMSNAVVYSDGQGRVVVTQRKVKDGDENFVEIAVADNGIGIKPDEQQRIFERFYRVDYGRSRASGGTGLGLAIVKHITAVHDGTVNVWSRPGQGSTFTLRFPMPNHDLQEAWPDQDDADEPETTSAESGSTLTKPVAPRGRMRRNP